MSSWPYPVERQHVQVGNLYVRDVRAEYPENPGWVTRELSDITTLFIHHTVHPNDWTDEECLRNLYYSHLAAYGGIGYNYCIGHEGIYYVGTLETIRAHTYGHNVEGVGIAFLGTFTNSAPATPVLVEAASFINNLRFGLGSNLPLQPHSAVVATICPGKALDALKEVMDEA